jgi:O-antigen/teichoic acid export membrane protein
MRKFEKLEIIKNVSSSWFGLALNVLVGIFLSPFILHRLGDEAFGIWVLIFSVTGYYGLFDFGIRSSIVRYVSKFTATSDNEDLARLINTSVFSYTCVGLLTLAITIAGSFYVDSIFKIPANFLATARWLFLMVGAAVALGFPLGVYGGILEGLQRFYFLNLTNIISTLLRALLIVVSLNRGYGLLTIALITVALPILTSLLRAAIVFHLLPIRFGWCYVDRGTFRKMANYGSITFMIILAGRLRFKTDAMVIGTFLSSAAITYFSIGSRLVDYATEVVSSLAQIFVPMSSQSDAVGNMDRLRKIYIAGNRACALVMLPMSAILIILGKSVIEAWVGAKYVAASYPVLVILVIPVTIQLVQGASGRILVGIGRHGKLAIATLIEGVSNLILSILLVRHYGIIGDALGTAIPLTCTMVFFLPLHLSHVLGVRVRTFLRQAFALPILLCTPMVVTLLLMQRWFVPHGYRQLAIHLLVGAVVYGAGLLWAFLSNTALHVEQITSSTKAQPDKVVVAPLVETYQEEV